MADKPIGGSVSVHRVQVGQMPMSQVLCHSASGWRTLLRSRPYTLTAIVFFTILVIPFCTRKRSDWDEVYLPAAGRLAHGGDIYQNGFVYPPINAWLALPFVGLSRVSTRLLWFAVNASAFVILITEAWRLSGGSQLEGNPQAPRREHVIFALGLLCGIFYALDTLTNQQSDLVVAALVLIGCRLLVRDRGAGAGVMFGLAAGIKCTPLLWSGYLVWRKRWSAAVLMLLVAVAINLIPDRTHPRPTSQPRVQEWARRYLVPMTARERDFGMWAASIMSNHSLAGIWNRWLTFEPLWHGREMEVVRRTERVAPETLKLVSGGSMLLFLAAALICSWKARRPAGGLGVLNNTTAPSPRALEYSLVLILMVLLCPHSSKPHFCTLILPGFCLARAALSGPDRRFLVFVLAAITCGLLSNKDLVGGRVYDWVLWHGSITWSAVLLHVGCCLALLRRPASETAAKVAENGFALNRAA